MYCKYTASLANAVLIFYDTYILSIIFLILCPHNFLFNTYTLLALEHKLQITQLITCGIKFCPRYIVLMHTIISVIEETASRTAADKHPCSWLQLSVELCIRASFCKQPLE